MSQYSVSHRANDGHQYIIFTGSDASVFTLPDAYVSSGLSFVFKNQGTGVATIATSAGQFIDGASTYTLSAQYTELVVFSDSKNWNIAASTSSGGGGGSQVNSDWNASSGVAQILNKPTIPAAQVNADWNASSGVAQISNKPTLAAVATSGSYTDLGNKPTIPAATPALVASGASHSAGYAPDPGASAGTTRFLREDATWATPPSGGGSTQINPTLRNIATRCTTLGFTNTGMTSLFSRTGHINRSDCTTGFQPVFANWYATFANEFTGYANYVLTASLEYPKGTYTRLTFSAATSITIAAGTNAVADACATIVPTGARFWINSIVNCPNGIFTVNGPTSDTNALVSGDQNLASATAIGTDYTMTPYVSSGAMTSMNPPVAILGMSTWPSVMCYGDSRLAGLKDSQWGTNGGFGGFGEITRSFDSTVAYCNAGAPTGTAAGFITAHTLRAALKQYHTHIHVQYGINDLNAGTTAAAIQTSMGTIVGYFPGMKVSSGTIPPQCTSTDAFLTQANQTQFAAAAQRQLYNTWLRGTTHPFSIVFDVSDVLEYHRSGNWLTPDVDPRVPVTITFEGTHESPWGYLFLQKSGAVDGRIYFAG